MKREDAIKTLKENLCVLCAYGSQNMESCDIRSCDNSASIKALEQEQFMNKPCVSAGVCEHDKIQMLDNLRVEINSLHNGCGLFNDGVDATLKIIDKYRTENGND